MSGTQTISGPKQDEALRWYEIGTKTIPEEMEQILRSWSGIPTEKLMDHVSRLVRTFSIHAKKTTLTGGQRKQAFETYPYPCIGQSKFLHANISNHPLYPQILSSLKNRTHTFLDAGCCFGQELRKLAFDGASVETLYGIDLESDFIDLGFDLFQDRQKMAKATFIAGDLLDPSQQWPELLGKIDFIFANSLLHLFSRADQVKVACKLASFSKARPGSLIIGRQMGSAVPGEFRALSEGATYFRHSPQSLNDFWQEVGQLTGTSWKTQAHLDMADMKNYVEAGQDWLDNHSRRLHFVVERLA
jgi:SAM-dependent methyltransferase